MRKLLLSLLFMMPVMASAQKILVAVQLVPGHDLNQARVELANKGWSITTEIPGNGIFYVENESFSVVDNGVQKSLDVFRYDPAFSDSKAAQLNSALDIELSLSHVDYYGFTSRLGFDMFKPESTMNFAIIDPSKTIYTYASNKLPGRVHNSTSGHEIGNSSIYATMADRKEDSQTRMHATDMASKMAQMFDTETDFFNVNDEQIYHFPVSDEARPNDAFFDNIVNEVSKTNWEAIVIPMSLPNVPWNGVPGNETVQQMGMRHFGDMAVDTNTPTFKSGGNPIWVPYNMGSIGTDYVFSGYDTRVNSITTPSNDVEIVGEMRTSIPGKDDQCPLPNEETPLPNGKHPNGKACKTMQVCPLDSTGKPTIRFSIDTDNLNLPLIQSVVPNHYTTKETVGGTSYAATMSGVYAQDVVEHIMGNGYARPDIHDVYAAMENATRAKNGYKAAREACTGWGVYDHAYTINWVKDHYPVVGLDPNEAWQPYGDAGCQFSCSPFVRVYDGVGSSMTNAFKERCAIVGGHTVYAGNPNGGETVCWNADNSNQLSVGLIYFKHSLIPGTNESTLSASNPNQASDYLKYPGGQIYTAYPYGLVPNRPN